MNTDQPTPQEENSIIHTTACAVAQHGNDMPYTCGGELSAIQPEPAKDEWIIGSPVTGPSNCVGYYIRDASGRAQAFVFDEAIAKQIVEAVNFYPKLVASINVHINLEDNLRIENQKLRLELTQARAKIEELEKELKECKDIINAIWI